jgi:hypothetical protein
MPMIHGQEGRHFRPRMIARFGAAAVRYRWPVCSLDTMAVPIRAAIVPGFGLRPGEQAQDSVKAAVFRVPFLPSFSGE